VPANEGNLLNSPRFRRAARAIAAFFLGQGAIQLIGILVGLYLIRHLDIQAYAQFGLAFAFQGTAGTLMDLGYTSTIIPLVGERTGDPRVVGLYVAAARRLRNLSFAVLSPIAAALFLLLMRKHHWPLSVDLLLLLPVLLTLYSAGRVAYSTAPFFMHREMRTYYVPQVISGLGRLAGYWVLSLLGALNSWTAAAGNAFSIMANGVFLSRRSEKLLTWPDKHDPAVKQASREILRYVAPAAPAIVFAAFQTQIATFLAGLFGQTAEIAQVAALGKLSQLFAAVGSFNIAIIEPYMSRLPHAKVASRYARLVAIAVLLVALVVTAAFLFPLPFIWLLGRQYRDLAHLVGWVMLSSCVYYIAGLLWIINRSRKWIFWRSTAVEVVLMLTVQVTFILIRGVRTTADLVYFSVAGSFAALANHLYTTIYGFRHGPRAPDAAGPSGPAEVTLPGDNAAGL